MLLNMFATVTVYTPELGKKSESSCTMHCVFYAGHHTMNTVTMNTIINAMSRLQPWVYLSDLLFCEILQILLIAIFVCNTHTKIHRTMFEWMVRH